MKKIKKLFVLLLISLVFLSFSTRKIENEIDDASVQKLKSIFQTAQQEKWFNLSINELIIKIANKFVGTPYVGGTLEGNYETCRINLNGLDCVTFVENVLNIARTIKQNKYSIEEVFNNLIETRYRDGVINDYTSRLHYTADWIFQNTSNHIVTDLTKSLGGIPIKFNVYYMSKNPHLYKSLANNEEYVEVIKDIEKKINSRTYYYIPVQNISTIENQLQNGDIICILTNKPGLDYAHLGLTFKHEDGSVLLLHASSTKKKVVVDTTISAYVNSIKSNIGITILRANEPSN